MNTPRKKMTSLLTLARWGIEPGSFGLQAIMLTTMPCHFPILYNPFCLSVCLLARICSPSHNLSQNVQFFTLFQMPLRFKSAKKLSVVALTLKEILLSLNFLITSYIVLGSNWTKINNLKIDNIIFFFNLSMLI